MGEGTRWDRVGEAFQVSPDVAFRLDEGGFWSKVAFIAGIPSRPQPAVTTRDHQPLTKRIRTMATTRANLSRFTHIASLLFITTGFVAGQNVINGSFEAGI